MFRDLDPILHSQLRLAIISVLVTVEQAEFNYLKEQAQATSGNLSIQINKLKEAGYIEVKKKFKGNYPQTICRITKLGIRRFEEYIDALQGYLGRNALNA
jgi:predicted transcriptional regulator